MYTAFWYICRLIVKFLFRVEVVGGNNIPRSGPVIIFSNHANNWDPFILASNVTRPVHFMAKEELFENPVLGCILKHIKAFPVKRGQVDRRAIRTALEVLGNGNVLGIFPEGTRNPSGDLLEPESGIAFFAVKNRDAMLVPVAIKGDYKPFSKLKVVFGEAFRPEMDKEKYDSKMLKELSVEIFSNVHQLISMQN